MMKNGFLVCGVMAFAMAACGGNQLGRSILPLAAENSLSANGLGTNGLGTNGLGTNGLGTNGLGTNGLGTNGLDASALRFDAFSPEHQTAIQDPGPEGDLSREVLRYMVSCALAPQQSFSFTWTDSEGARHDETYEGLLGLETSWATSPLSSEGAQWVSACLAARVNQYHTHVTLSLRGSHPALATTATERDDYDHEEGVFWGNFFDPARPFYACYNSDNVTNSHLQLRDCASGHVDDSGNVQQCGIIRILGNCNDFCTGLGKDQYRPSCRDDQGRESTAVVTVFLEEYDEEDDEDDDEE